MKMRLCDVGSWGVCVTPWRRLCGGDVSVEILEAFFGLDEEAIERLTRQRTKYGVCEKTRGAFDEQR